MLGIATGEFKRDGLPGDAKGMITLVARVEDNEELGNLITEMPVPWGKYYSRISPFLMKDYYGLPGTKPFCGCCSWPTQL
ncbi:MAG: hypothetical protein C4308_13655 [Chitinophagaceae bacterium]